MTLSRNLKEGRDWDCGVSGGEALQGQAAAVRRPCSSTKWAHLGNAKVQVTGVHGTGGKVVEDEAGGIARGQSRFGLRPWSRY